MSFMRWEAAYNTGIREIDQQHQQLVALINELYENHQSGQNRRVMANALSRLITYAAMHFSREETLFDRFEYPDAEAHKKEHLDFEEKILDFEKQFNQNEAELGQDMLKFLSGWLIGHIQGSDQLYVPHLKIGLL